MSETAYDQSPYGGLAEEEEAQEQGGSSSGPGGKRKRDEGGTQHRTKRTRYTSLACNECKRRKIKCNGETPCQRCGNLKLECVYEPNCCSGNLKHSNEFKQLTAHVAHLEGQIQYLLQNLDHLRNSIGQDDFPNVAQYQQAQSGQQDTSVSIGGTQTSMAIDPSLHFRPPKSTAQQSRFQGPTSPAFSLGVAQHSLKHMGISSIEEAIDQGILSQSGLQNDSPATTRVLHSSKDPIWGVTKDEALRLCRVFEDENGLMYPILDIDQIMRHASLLFSFMDAAQKAFMLSALPGADSMQDEDTDVLKLVLAIAMVTEGTGHSDLGKRLFEQVNKAGDSRMLGSVNLKDIQILTLTAIYHFHSDDEGLAWRVIGMTARLCLELGLHRSETYATKFKDERERTGAVKLFWSVYVLDHRWSMGTGMSFALQDADLDKTLPTPEDSSPYLATMIHYSRIGAKVWKAVSSADSSGNPSNSYSKEDASYLDYQVLQWYRSIPKHLRFMHPDAPGNTSQAADNFNRDGGRGLYRLRVLLYLRQNQMRITIYRPILHSTASIAANTPGAQTAVEVAKDTIRVLKHIDSGSDVYRTQQMTWNHFLLAALAALALAVCHAPNSFSEMCREEFLMALDLVRGLSGNSYVSKRLWRTIRNLRELGPRLGGNNGRSQIATIGNGNAGGHGQTQGDQPQNDAQRSAAMAMAGLATGHPVDETAFFENHAQGTTDLNSNITRNDQSGQPLTSPNGMANELTNLFEAAGVLGASGTGGAWPNTFGDLGQSNNGGQGQGQHGALLTNDGRAWTNDNEELGRILRELY